MPKELLLHNLWWDGPDWLLDDPISVPWQPPRKPLSTPEQRVVSCNVLQAAPPPLLETKYSSYHKLISITAWCLRFYHRLKKTHPPDPGTNGRHLSAQELNQAEHLLAKLSQVRSFPKERHALLHGHSISPSSRLLSLSPFLDQELCSELEEGCLTHLLHVLNVIRSSVTLDLKTLSCCYYLPTCIYVLGTVAPLYCCRQI